MLLKQWQVALRVLTFFYHREQLVDADQVSFQNSSSIPIREAFFLRRVELQLKTR